MRIALVHTRLLYRGGLESRMFSYLNFFHHQGHKVTVVVYKRGADVEVPEGVDVRLLNLGITPKPLRAPVFNRKLGRLLENEQFDLVISMGRTTHHDAMIVAGNHKAYMRARGWKFKGISDRVQIWMDDRAYRAPGTLLPASEMLKAQIMTEHGVPADKIKVLYPPTDPKRFHQGHKAQRDEFRAKYNFTPGKTSFLLLSANHVLKGLPLLLEVFSRFGDAPVELLVAGGKPVQTDLPNVRHLGFVKETEELYAAADFTLLPSLYDSFGQVVTESLLCGTPVLVSEMTGAKAIVGEKEGLVVASFEPEKWKDAMEKAMQMEFEIDPNLAESRGIRFEDHMAQLLACAR